MLGIHETLMPNIPRCVSGPSKVCTNLVLFEGLKAKRL